MKTHELEQRIRNLIDQRRFNEIIEVFKEFKANKGKQSEAYSLMEKILLFKRNEKDESSEEFILEVMDIIAGFCLPERKIWESNLR